MTAAHARVTVDVGAGDGHATLRTAGREPRTLAIALDASADALVDGARTALRRRLGNALFVVSSIESLPGELDGVADAVTVSFPWGSLLRGLALADERVVAPLARLVKPGAVVDALLSVEERDRAGIAVSAEGLAANEYAGFNLVACRPATPAEIDAVASSWAKRLDAKRERSVLRLILSRRSQGAADSKKSR